MIFLSRKAIARKGFVYLSMTIILITVAMVYILTQGRDTSGPDVAVTTARIQGLDYLTKDIDRDLERAIAISGFRSLLAIAQWESQSGRYVTDLDTSFREIFLNGTYNGTAIDVMEDNSMRDWFDKFSLLALRSQAGFEANVQNISVQQKTPWEIEVLATMELSLYDLANATRWTWNTTFVAPVAIEGLEDPSYALETDGLLFNQVRQAPTLNFVSGTDVTNLQVHVNESYYVASSFAPSFLMRLQGDFSSSPHGIESLVNIDKLELAGGSASSGYWTVVDYLYFQGGSGSGSFVDGMPSWFKIDNGNLGGGTTRHEFYEVEELV